MSTEPTGGLADRLTRLFWRSPAEGVGERCRRRVTVYLIPYLFFLYVLAYLDRVNVSVAGMGMILPPEEGGLGFDKHIMGIGAGMFFWGYWILEIPSTVSVLKWGARWVFVRILVLWGLACTLIGAIGTAFTQGMFGWLPQLPPALGGVADFVNGLPSDPVHQFYFFRFMLGFFEGGFFPSVIVYLSLWFRPEDRAKAIATFMAAIPISNIFGAPLSGFILENVHWAGLPGWRWVFILQGIVPVVAGITTIFMLPDRPEQADWLPDDEKQWLQAELDKEHAVTQGHGHWDWMQQAGVVLLFTAAYLAMNTASYGLQMFMPMIMQSLTGSSALNATFLTAVLFTMALAGMLWNAWHSDKKRERIWHTVAMMSLLSIGLGAAAFANHAGLSVLAFLLMAFVMGPGMYSWLPSYWPMPRKLMGAMAAASAVGFINMLGNLGGAIGPWIVGSTPDFTTAMFILAGMPLIGAAIIVTIGLMRRKELMDQPASETQSIPDQVQAEA